MPEISERAVSMKLTRDPMGPTLSASTPLDISRDEFVEVALNLYDLVNKLTGCNCLSGLIRFVTGEEYVNVARVELGRIGSN